MMNREQAIDILMHGYKTFCGKHADGSDCLGDNCGRKCVSFGQLEPEVQAVAREIGRSNFEFYIFDGTLVKCCEKEFANSETVNLRQDYIDPPKVKVEPEYEYLGIKTDTVERTYFFNLPDHVWPNNQVQKLEGHLVSEGQSIVGFLGYAKSINQKDSFSRTFTPDMKFVVLKKW